MLQSLRPLEEAAHGALGAADIDGCAGKPCLQAVRGACRVPVLARRVGDRRLLPGETLHRRPKVRQIGVLWRQYFRGIGELVDDNFLMRGKRPDLVLDVGFEAAQFPL